jgi:hypothetical protein
MIKIIIKVLFDHIWHIWHVFYERLNFEVFEI